MTDQTPEELLLACKTKAEFDALANRLAQEQPGYLFSPEPLALGAPLTPLTRKIIELTAAEEAAEEAAASSPKKAKAPKAKKEKEAPPPLTIDGMVVYADAGATQPAPHFTGFGLHGYLYCDQIAKKGSGNPGIALLDNGYALKSLLKDQDKVGEVTPMKYIDGFASLPSCTNNAGEVTALREGLIFASRYDLKRVSLYSDSKYAVDGATQYLPRWRANNWIRQDGTVIKNVELWQGVGDAMDALQAKGVMVNVQWCKGHTEGQHTSFGNNVADRYASMGVKLSLTGVIESHVETSDAEGYWGAAERHPFIHHACTYFTSNALYNKPGEYYFGDHGKDDELIGKRQADTSYAYVVLDTPEPLIEIVRRRMLETADTEDVLAFVSLNKVFEPTCARDLVRFGLNALHRPKNRRIDLHYIDKDPVLVEINPPRISKRAIDAVNTLKGVLLEAQAETPSNTWAGLVKTDITREIYDIDEKGNYKLRSEFGPGFTTLKVNALYSVENAAQSTTELGLVLGVDTPERNALKRLEKLKPEVTLVTWREANAIRYATIVKASDGIGIWAGYYANMKYLKAA